MMTWKTFAAGAVIALGFGSAAQAITLQFDQYQSGQYIGDLSIATLEANDISGGVELTLTNNALVGGLDAFITRLFLNNDSDATVAVSNVQPVGGVAYSGLETWNVDKTDAGFKYDIRTSWPTSNQLDRLNIGESSTFRLLGSVSLASLFSDMGKLAMIHVQGLETPDWCKDDYSERACAGSTKYVATISAVPLPAGGVLLLTALGGLAAARRRKSA